mgnify:CR=1 FL=1
MTVVDARGLRHPDHINAFRREFSGLCTVFEDIEIFIDDCVEERKTLEMFLRSCHGTYRIDKAPEGFLRVIIEQPFSFCG